MTKNQSFVTRLRYAMNGLRFSVRAEHSMRAHVIALCSVAIVMMVLAPAPIWWALVSLACAVVMAAELVNTAVERLADRLHPERHPEIKIVKDCAAAAVLVSSLGAIGVAVALVVHLLHRP